MPKIIECSHCHKQFAAKIGPKNDLCSIECRFWSRVARAAPDQCWLWTGPRYWHGYGDIIVERRHRYAHRFSWQLHHGPIPDGLLVLHECDIKLCVNPAHLHLGTNQDNSDEAVERGRVARGARHSSRTRPDAVPRGERHWMRRMPERIKRGDSWPRSKLSTETAAEIRALVASGLSKTAAAKLFAVSEATVRRVVAGKAWLQ